MKLMGCIHLPEPYIVKERTGGDGAAAGKVTIRPTPHTYARIQGLQFVTKE